MKLKKLSKILLLASSLSLMIGCANTEKVDVEEDGLKVTLILDEGGVNDASFNESAWNGALATKEKYKDSIESYNKAIKLNADKESAESAKKSLAEMDDPKIKSEIAQRAKSNSRKNGKLYLVLATLLGWAGVHLLYARHWLWFILQLGALGFIVHTFSDNPITYNNPIDIPTKTLNIFYNAGTFGIICGSFWLCTWIAGFVLTPHRNRFLFMFLGVILGWAGIHLLYARRWLWFILQFSSMCYITYVKYDCKGEIGTFCTICVLYWLFSWIIGTLFISHDGKGTKMKFFE